MPEPESQTTLILLSAIAGLLFFATLILLRLSWRLSRIEGVLREKAPSKKKAEPVEPLSSGGAFGKFLAEHPDLIPLTKSEQFAAFRKWRKEQGLNWEGR